MPEKISVNFDREAAAMDWEVATERREKLRKKFENKSYWPLIKKGPLGTVLYGMFLYPRVFFDHIIKNNPSYSLTIYQETILRTMKWSTNSTMKTMRKSGSFIELLIRTFRCSEKFYPLKADVKTQLGGIEGYWLGPIKYKQMESEATILYLHGGGYIALSSLIGIGSLCYILKKLRKRHNKHVRVLAIDYPLAPENPFPAGLNCAERTYRWLVNSGIAGSKNVFLCGDSAGAGLALALLQRLYPDKPTNDDTIALPLGSILISPWVELSCDSLSYLTNAKYDWLAGHFAQFAAEHYIFGKAGNPRRNRLSQQQQKKLDKDMVMDWLEKVENTFDFIDVESNFKRFSYEWNKRLSNYSLSSNKSKRHSFKAGKRGSKSAKRRSRIRTSMIDPEEITVQIHKPEEALRRKRECWVCSEKLQFSRTIEENPYRDPLISPLHIPHHILAKFPPLFISYGGKEVFKDDIEIFIQKCIESKRAYTTDKSFDGNDFNDNSLDGQHPDIIVETDEDMVHDYAMFKDIYGNHSKKCLDRIVHFIAGRVPPTSPFRSPRSSKSSKTKKFHPSVHSDSISIISSNSIPNSRKIPNNLGTKSVH